MKRIPTLLAALLMAASLSAGERTLKDWLKDLEARIRRTDNKRKSTLIAAASVRGAKGDDDARKLYWKGQKDAQPVADADFDRFKAAVGMVKDGKPEEAEKALQDFLAAAPDSPLAPDAKETLALLKKEAPSAAPDAAETKPAP